MKERRGRGRLNSIELLPDWAEPAVLNAYKALRDQKVTQLEILDSFNAELRLLAMQQGITDPPVISRSAFNRKSMRLARLAARLAETREIASVLAARLEDGGDEKLTLMASEAIKSIVFDALDNAGEIVASPATAEMMANFASAVKSAEQTKKITADTKLMIERRFRQDTEKAISTAAARQGLSEEQAAALLARIRQEVYGLEAR